MNKNDILAIFEYNYWANRRMLNAARQLSTEQYYAPMGLSHTSLHGTLLHMFGAEVLWRLRCLEGTSPTSLPSSQELPSLEDITQRWAEEEQTMRRQLEALGDEQLAAVISYRTTQGVPYQAILWTLLAHLVNHGTQHRSEAAVALTSFGHSPGDLDMLLFFRERA